MATEFHFNQLDPTSFQRLINAVLTARFGDPIRLFPLRGRDGGRDSEIPAETRPVFRLDGRSPIPGAPVRNGAAVFQVKHHRTLDGAIANIRNAVVVDFEKELQDNILPSREARTISSFFLVTNVPASRESIEKVDQKKRELLRPDLGLNADVLWGEHVTAWLDQYPQIWSSFPDLFAGRIVPSLAALTSENPLGVARSHRLALRTQYNREKLIRFRQIELEEKLTRLFVDLDAALPDGGEPEVSRALAEIQHRERSKATTPSGSEWELRNLVVGHSRRPRVSSMVLFTSEEIGYEQAWPRKFVIEGGPGQGKSTLTQMLVQVYRALLLNELSDFLEFSVPEKARVPFRIELRLFADWLSANGGSVEQYMAQLWSKDAGGASITVEEIQQLVEGAGTLLIFDGLDEVGSDDLRDAVLTKIAETVERWESLDKSARFILTTRPPAIAGKSSRLAGFVRLQLMPLEMHQVDQYIKKWTDVLCSDIEDRERVTNSFNKRREEVHVSALAKNPMQLSVLLQFIRFKGEAFPDKRAELYREYFRTVIDRDVEKSPRLLSRRADIENLHEVIAFKIHSTTDSDKPSSSLTHSELISTVQDWLISEDRQATIAHELFRLGEERLGLIVAVAGEAGQTRYGFEIQPVREYFAAAYINERVVGNAHDYFQEMIRRPFWREVALFLAGLRRANEKADLLLRARVLDEDARLGWRQDGSATVLELLQEGVLTSPGHVHRDSVSFLLRLFDPEDRSPRNEPKALLNSVARLVKNCGAPIHIEQLRSFLEKAPNCLDKGALERLYRVAFRSLDSAALREALEKLAPEDNTRSALAHIAWPKLERVNLADISRSSRFWPAKPSATWARVWFERATREMDKADLRAPVRYHSLLLEQFAFTTARRRHRQHGMEHENAAPPSRWAVWWLHYYLGRLCGALSGEKVVAPDLPQTANFDVIGLDPSVAEAVKELTETCAALARVSGPESISISEATRFLECVTEWLGADGLAGWVACRCAVSLLQVELGRFGVGYARIVSDPELGEVHYYVDDAQRHSKDLVRLAKAPMWSRMTEAVLPFFQRVDIGTPRSKRDVSAARVVRDGLSEICPANIRNQGVLRSVLPGSTRPTNDVPDLIGRVPIPQCWFRALLSERNVDLSILLREISRRYTFAGPHVPLSVQAIKKVVAFVRRSNDREALSGALVSLVDSSFWRVMDQDLLLKIVEADAENADVGYRLFDRHSERQKNASELLDLARSIVDQTRQVSRNTACAAAEYCARNLPTNFDPLTSVLRPSLKPS